MTEWQKTMVPCPQCGGQRMKTWVAQMCAACRTAQRKAVQRRALGERRAVAAREEGVG